MADPALVALPDEQILARAASTATARKSPSDQVLTSRRADEGDLRYGLTYATPH